jgi:hypothetical protein
MGLTSEFNDLLFLQLPGEGTVRLTSEINDLLLLQLPGEGTMGLTTVK